jgi:hypothetical protein
MRALMLGFDRWVRDGVEPPPSTYPRIADGTLVTVAAHALAFPRIPDFRLPEGNLRPPRLDLGSRFETDRIAYEVPPITGKPFETLVPKPDADGLDQGGIVLPELLAPLGTRTGFNTRNDAPASPGPRGGGTARSCRSRVPNGSGRRPATRVCRWKRVMPVAPPMRPRYDRPPPMSSVEVFCCPRTSMRWWMRRAVFTIASWRMTPPIGAVTICSAAEPHHPDNRSKFQISLSYRRSHLRPPCGALG